MVYFGDVEVNILYILNIANGKLILPEWTSLEWVSVIGSIFSIISVGITIYLAFNTRTIKDRVNIISNIETLKKEKKSLINDLKSCQDLIEQDEKRGISDLSRIIRQLEEYKGLMEKSDLVSLKSLKRSVGKPEKRDKEKTLIYINALIGFLELNTNNKFKHM